MNEQLAEAVIRALEDAPCPQREIALESGIDPSIITRLIKGEYRVGEHHAAAILGALERLRDRYKNAARQFEESARRIRRAQRRQTP